MKKMKTRGMNKIGRRFRHYLLGIFAILFNIFALTSFAVASPNMILFTWGSSGSGPGQFFRLGSIGINASGNVYVADIDNNRVQVFDQSGNFLRAWGSSGTGNGEFQHPEGVAVNSSGFIFVVDTGNYRVQVFTATGQFVTKWGTQGTEDGKFLDPRFVAISPNGNVLVADYNSRRIQEFSPTGNFLDVFEVGTNIFGITFDTQGRIYVSGASEGMIGVFNGISKAFLYNVGGYGSLPGQLSGPVGIAVNSSGFLHVADTGNIRLQVFDSSGKLQSIWSPRDENRPEIQAFSQIAINVTGHIYLVDTFKSLIVVLNPLPPNAPDIPLIIFIICVITTVGISAILVVRRHRPGPAMDGAGITQVLKRLHHKQVAKQKIPLELEKYATNIPNKPLITGNDPQAWYENGEQLSPAEQLNYFEAGLEKDPTFHPWAWCGIGLYWLQLKDYYTAAASYERALKLDPKMIYAWKHLNLVNQAIGDAKGAEAASQRARELDPSGKVIMKDLKKAPAQVSAIPPTPSPGARSLRRKGFNLMWMAFGWIFGWSLLAGGQMGNEISRLMAKGWSYQEALSQALIAGGVWFNVPVILILLILAVKNLRQASRLDKAAATPSVSKLEP